MIADDLPGSASSVRKSTHQGYAIESHVTHHDNHWYAMFLLRGPTDSDWTRHLCRTRHDTEDAAHSAALQTAKLAINVQLGRL